jgi:hypothetical protein
MQWARVRRVKKKILIGLGVFLVLIAGSAAYVLLVANKRSPQDTVSFSQGGVDAKVVYCRPYKKGRLIFGEKTAGALVPFDEYWRLGANDATQITFAKGVSFAGKPVNAGTYWMYAIPGAKTWKVVLNSETGKWGARPADTAKDVLSVEVPAEAMPNPVEQFTISFASESPGAQMDFVWDTTRVRVPLAAN